MSMIEDFIFGFLRGVGQGLHLVEEDKPRVRVRRLERPTREEMKRYISSHARRTMFHRFDMEYRGEIYYCMYAYIRSAVYTVVYDRRAKRNPRFKILAVLNGKASVRESREALHFALKERKRVAGRDMARWGLKQQRRASG